ncbi:C4-dicarboxylate ABC transporter permease [Alkalilimnicola ehrlichii]|uniref:TRAP transporter large permease protein n=1 Tax=Alkalilimnicola ehrlichii TaxID=351052 RepID=A0A3E0WF74_9GAMM|nr:TRAP transporter large permease [Alkalilimnicola ehrlichii]RFA24389.1 C4-dicarboxylate ABC transporter permease [Alkalilimnicola ehrlichii]RFA31582.1 C4-dicarboxylate ABC transporter permease [Alkalilimnicola ehrlichii]
MVTVLALVMLTLLLLGFPMLVPLLAGALLLALVFIDVDPSNLISAMVRGIEPEVLVAVPMFIFAADLMTHGQTANRLLDLVMSFIRHIRGGLPITTAASCTLFGAVSGSTQATVVAMGQPLRPKLLQAGYKDSFALALIINASDIALLIPPSIGMIIYGVVSGTSVGELFIAGIGPGLLILCLFSIYCYIVSRRQNIPILPPASWRERRRAVVRGLLPLGFPVIVIGGIYTGNFSPTEAGAMSVLYALFLELAVFRKLKLVDIPAIALSTGLITAVVFILVGAGGAFSWAISFAQIPQLLLGDFIANAAQNPTLVLVFICLAFFVGCMFVDPIVVILVLTPLFAPAIQMSGLDPVLVGTLITLQVAIGSATPPFGCDIFTAIAVFRRPYLEVIRGTPPFIAILISATGLLIAFPQIALFLRDLAYG